MNNPNDKLESFETYTDKNKPDVKKVWLLNLIPYAGVGYFYALGAKQALVPMVFIWMFMLAFGPATIIPMYFILSVLGTAHILNKHSDQAKKLRQSRFNHDVDSVPFGKQIPLAESSESEYSLSTLESKAKKATKSLKRLKIDEDYDAKSKHAVESFEYKAQAAEKMLKARNDAPDAVSDFAPAAAASEPSGQQINELQPGSIETPPGSSDSVSGSSDYINQVNSSYSIDAEVAGITSGVTRGASADSVEVSDFLTQATAANDAALTLAQSGESLQASQTSEAVMTGILANADQSTAQIQSPNVVPEISSQIALSESYIPEVTDQYSTEPLPVPGNTSTGATSRLPDNTLASAKYRAPEADSKTPASNSFLVNSDQSVPDISAELVNSTQVTPELNSIMVDSTQTAPDVSSMWVNSTEVTPDVSSMSVNSTQTAPDVSSMIVNSTQDAPDVSSMFVNSTQNAPDVNLEIVNSTQTAPEVSAQLPDSSLTSFGNFESPKFSFSFDDHMATPLATDVTLAGGASVNGATVPPPCSKCGAARDANFSFCLACGQSFV